MLISVIISCHTLEIFKLYQYWYELVLPLIMMVANLANAKWSVQNGGKNLKNY